MKYPITPEYLKRAPDELNKLYENLEEFILIDICKRLSRTGAITNTAIEQIRTLKRLGYDQTEIEKQIRKTLKLSKSVYDKLWEDAVERNNQYYSGIATKASLLVTDTTVETIAMQSEALKLQTFAEFKNLTRSMGFAMRGLDGKVTVSPIGKVYQNVLDSAEMRVLTGASSFNEALRDSIKTLADSGLQWVDYESGHHNRIEVATRRAIVTGITQISSKYSEIYGDEFETPYVEVSAHIGARDVAGSSPWSSHKAWQGKVYSKREGDKYPSVYKVCGLGAVDGLCGINCRHMYYPFVDGISERTWTDEQLKNIDPEPFEYEGRKYTAYEASQVMRKLETAMRKEKREIIAFDYAGLEQDSTDATIRFNRLREEYGRFAKVANLREQLERIEIG